MNILKKSSPGIVLPSVLMLILCGFIFVSVLAVYSGRSLVLTRRTMDYQRASTLAESCIAYGIKYAQNNKIPSTHRIPTDTIPNYDGEYKNGIWIINNASSEGGGTVNSSASTNEIWAISQNVNSKIASAIYAKIVTTIDCLGDYAAFYEYDLEAWPGENMTFKGKVHSNGNLWIGADKLMKFEDVVTASKNFYAQRKPNSGYDNSQDFYVKAKGRVQFKKTNGEYADVINEYYDNYLRKTVSKRMDYTGIDNWSAESYGYYGDVLQTSKPKLTALISVTEDPHAIIDRRKDNNDSDYEKSTEEVKFANKACLTIHIDSEGKLHLYDRKNQPINDPDDPDSFPYMQPAVSVSKASTTTGQYNVQQGSYTSIDDQGRQKTEQLPAYQVDNYIYDRREDSVMQPVDIYVDQILQNDALKSYLYPSVIASDEMSEPGVLYITRDEPKGYPVIKETRKTVTIKDGDDYIDTVLAKSETEKKTLESKGYSENTAKSQTSSFTTYTYTLQKTTVTYVMTKSTTTYTYKLTKRVGWQTQSKTVYTQEDVNYWKQQGWSLSQTTPKTTTDTKNAVGEEARDSYIAQGYTQKSSSSSTDTKTANDEAAKTNWENQGYHVTQKTPKTTTTYAYCMEKLVSPSHQEEIVVAVTNYIPTQPCVRIRNASDLRNAKDKSGKTVGLSIATDLPMYVEGCYNTDGGKGSSNDSCVNKPASLVAADAVTMLSSAWDDNRRKPKWDGWNENMKDNDRESQMHAVRPAENLSERKAVETTFNGILMTGLVESDDGKYSGGLQNLFRFHEHWRPSGTIPYNFNGSMICMWLSKTARHRIESSYTYEPPSRPWSWARFQPPGLPDVKYSTQREWMRIDVNDYPDKSFFNN